MDDPLRCAKPEPIEATAARFVGDFGDPWVVAIADALPPGTARVCCAGDLTDAALGGPVPGVLVLHRQTLSRQDAERLKRFRASRAPAPRVVLCHGPHVRYEDVKRWAELVDTVLPEATARDTLARQVVAAGSGLALPGRPRPAGPRPRVAVVSTNFALRLTLAEAVAAAGYTAEPARDFSGAMAVTPGPAVWDVPWLDPGWPKELSGRTKLGPVIALIGFADRALVTEARASGASACLDLPHDLGDLAAALDRVAALPRPSPEPAHEVPPPPVLRRLGTGARAGARARDEGE